MKSVLVSNVYFIYGQLDLIVIIVLFSFLIFYYFLIDFLKDLLNEYLMWVPEALHFEIRLKCPPI